MWHALKSCERQVRPGVRPRTRPGMLLVDLRFAQQQLEHKECFEICTYNPCPHELALQKWVPCAHERAWGKLSEHVALQVGGLGAEREALIRIDTKSYQF